MDPGPRVRPRLFLDTNILLSGIFFSGNEARLLALADVALLTSDTVLEEAEDVIAQAQAALPKHPDAEILAAALAARTDALITGDHDFFQESVRRLIRVATTKQIFEELGVL